jgi:hypothetical protein
MPGMSVTHEITPPPGPDHQCINASCGCNDLVTAGGCAEWCMEHTTEAGDLKRGKSSIEDCKCGHATCINSRPAPGTAERGMA